MFRAPWIVKETLLGLVFVLLPFQQGKGFCSRAMHKNITFAQFSKGSCFRALLDRFA